MIKTRKTLSIFLAVLMMFVTMLGYATAKAETTIPEVIFVGVEHSPLVEGDSETFYLTSKNYTGDVQYRVFLYTEEKDTWNELTHGYIEAVNPGIPYKVVSDKIFDIGKYKLSVWVKRAGTAGMYANKNGEYDSYYVADLNCVNKDDSNRVYANGEMDIPKSEYTLGENVVINGIKDISGMKAPYSYKLNYYDIKNEKWVKDVTDYASSITWKPDKAGTYILDVWAKSSDSTAPYESWKLKEINVIDAPVVIRGGGHPSKIRVSAIGAISGAAKVCVELTAGALAPAGATVTYQWKICDTVDGIYTDIAGATANKYIPVIGDVGKFIKVSATGTGSYSGTVTSAATGAVAAALPSQSGSPAFTAGIPAKTLTQMSVGLGNLGIQSNIIYTWYSSDNATYEAGIDTQVARDTTIYTPAAADVGKYLIVVATTPDATGNGTVVIPAVVAKIIGPMAPSSITGTFPVEATSINLENLSGITELEAAVAIDGVTYGSYADLVVDGSGKATISGLSGVTTSTKVKIRVKETPTTLPGPDTVITVTSVSLVSILVSLTDLLEKGLVITEGEEDSRKLTVSLSNDTFVQTNITTGNITITGLPAGVTVGSAVYINPTIITITLAGNSTADYDTNITATVNVASAALTLGGADRTADIVFTAVVEAALDAPTFAVVDDANDTFGWTNNATQTNAADYEYSVDSGANWTTCTANPQTGIIGSYAAGVVQVRAKATLRNPASAALVSTAPFNPSVTVAVSNGAYANSISPTFTVTNTSSYALNLTTLKLNYYYTRDSDELQEFQCYIASTMDGFNYIDLTSYVVGNIYKLYNCTCDADTYLQVSFTAGSLPSGQSMTVLANVHRVSWTSYNQSNDYSYNASNNVTAYVNEVKVFGTAPQEY